MNGMRRLLLPLFLAAIVAAVAPLTAIAATDPGLASAGNFAVLANTTVTDAPAAGGSWITGLVGVATPPGATTGFPPGTSGTQHHADSVAVTAETDLAAAYTNAAGQPCTNNQANVNLGGQILVPGVVCQSTAPTLTGVLTLDGGGSTTGVWIFQIGGTLVTAPGAVVRLINGAQPCDVFWQVASSVTLDTSTTFVGNVMALASIAMNNGATLNGRALARNGAVTLIRNRIIQPSGCGYPVPAFVAGPVGTTLPATLGIPWELIREVPWLLVIGFGTGFGALVLGVNARRRRRRTA